MDIKDLKSCFSNYYSKCGYKVLPSSSMINPNIPTSFVMSVGLLELQPILIQEEASAEWHDFTMIQRCIRHFDIEKVGNANRLSFFEMAGAISGSERSLESVIYSHHAFIHRELGFCPKQICYTVFDGGTFRNTTLDRDELSISTLRKLGVSQEQIYLMGADTNLFGTIARESFCGPSLETFVDRGEIGGITQHECAPGCECGRYIEIGNIVFLKYKKVENGLEPLGNTFCECAMGIERTALALSNLSTVYDLPELRTIKDLLYQYVPVDSQQEIFESNMNICCDHLRAIIFAIADGATAGHGGRRYVLRKLIRRFLVHLSSTLDDVLDDIDNVITLTAESNSHILQLSKTQIEVIASVIRNEWMIFKSGTAVSEHYIHSEIYEADSALDIDGLFFLTRPLPYEELFSDKNASDEEARCTLLEKQLDRLYEVGWLKNNVLSLHLLDWDLRKAENRRFSKHIPLYSSDANILLWYGMLGLIISADHQRMKYSLTHFVFEKMCNKNPMEISLVTDQNKLFSIKRVPLTGTTYLDEKERMLANDSQCITCIKVSMPKISKIMKSLEHCRDKYLITAKDSEYLDLGIKTLGDAQQLLLKNPRISEELSLCTELIVKRFSELLDLSLESSKYSEGIGILLPSDNKILTKSNLDSANAEIRSFLASIILLIFFSPPELPWSAIALIPGVSISEGSQQVSSEGFFVVLKKQWENREWHPWVLLANLWAREKAVFDFREIAKYHEQRLSVSRATHMIDTPLNSLWLLVEQLPNITEQKKALKNGIENLLRIREFSRCAYKRITPNFRTDALSLLLEDINNIGNEICLVLQNHKASGWASLSKYIGDDGMLWKNISNLVFESTMQWKQDIVEWCHEQLYAVLDGSITNALKYNRTDQKAKLVIKIDISFNCVYLIVTSASDMPWDRLCELGCELTNNQNIDVMGISIIQDSCLVCNYESPRWEAIKELTDDIVLQTTIQIARVVKR
jgi:hypothetical protein